MPAMASAISWTILLIMRCVSSGRSGVIRGDVAPRANGRQGWLPRCRGLHVAAGHAKPARGSPHVKEADNGASGVFGGRGRAREPADRRIATSRRGIVHAGAD